MRRNMPNGGWVTWGKTVERNKWASKMVPALLKEDESERLPVLIWAQLSCDARSVCGPYARQ